MKRGVRYLVLVVAISSTVVPVLAQPRQAQPVQLNKLSDRLYEVVGGSGARGGAYVGDDAVLLIDSKMDKASVDQVLAAVKAVTDKPIKYLVNTHGDGDHIRGNQYMPATITVIAHENCRKEFFLAGRDGKPSEWTNPDLARFVPSVTFRDKMEIYLGSKKVELWYFGVGHTTGDTVVYFPEEKTAFIGDQAFVGRVPLIHAYKGGSSFEQVKTLRKMLATLEAATTFCTGHSDPIDRNGVLQHVTAMEARQAKVQEMVKQGKTLNEAKAAFSSGEAGLIEIIWNEVQKSGPSKP
jgi:cyclase